MAKLTRGIGRGIVDGLNCLFVGSNNDTGLVRMFETEYSKEARFARRSGVQIDDNFVRSFLSMNSR